MHDSSRRPPSQSVAGMALGGAARRRFLRSVAGVLAVGGASPLLPGCDAGGRDTPTDYLIIGALGARLGPRLMEVLDDAALAPSAHNSQPWTVTVTQRHNWIIGSDRGRWLPVVDPENRELLLSIGAFLENLTVAAAVWGYQLEYGVMAEQPTDSQLVAVNLRPGSAPKGGLEAVRRRRTLREGFQTREIEAADVAAVTHGLEGFHFFPPGSAQAKYLAEGTIEANRAQLGRDLVQAELANWIRWCEEDIRFHGNGLTPAGMEIDGIAGWYARHFFNRDTVLSESFRRQSLERVVEQVRRCGGWIAVTSDGIDVSNLIETGRRFERFFLRLRDKKIALHPMSQLLEEEPWRSQVPRALGLRKPVQFILRAGYRDSYPEPVSPRMRLSAFVRG